MKAFDFKTKKHPFRYTDLILLPLVVACIIITIVFSVKPKGSEVVITKDGKEYGRYQLSENRVIPVGKAESPLMRVVIENGEVRCIDSTCPDKLCQAYSISKANSMIICLPNKIFIKIEGSNKDYDYISK